MAPTPPIHHDFIIVGAGTSGAVVAGNLSRSRQHPKVLVIEGGGDNKRPDLRVASERFTNVVINPELCTKFETVPQRHLAGRSLDYLRGRGVGGSSIANFEAYIRGSASDYDEWASQVGDDFFAWRNAVERYKEIESLHFDEDFDSDEYVKLAKGAHGFDGPLDITVHAKRDWHWGQEKLMNAAQEFGWPVCRDQNSGNPIGVGCTSTTTHKGMRTTSGTAYLEDPPSNLEILCDVTVQSIILDTNDSGLPKAIGVRTSGGKEYFAKKEVILSAGAIDSPRLLLLSGIGPRSELKQVGIPCIVDLPDVGKHLIDHVWTTLHWSVTAELSDDAAYIGDKAAIIASRQRWLRDRTGADAIRNLPNLIGFLKLNPETADLSELKALPPDVQYWIRKPDVPQIEIFLKAIPPEDWRLETNGEFMGLTIMLMNPQSRGEVTLASKEPSAQPVLDPGYLSHPYDRQTLVEGVREALAYVRTTSLQAHVRKEVLTPATDRVEDVLKFCQETIGSVLHGCGSVRMGKESQATACLDTHFRVRGTASLRVMDLSAIPLITNNHTIATAFVVGQMAWKRLADEYGFALPERHTPRL